MTADPNTIVVDIVIDDTVDLTVDAAAPIDVTPVIATPFTVVAVPGPPGPRGPGGSGAQIFGEIPAGNRDGINMVYTLTHSYQPGSIAFFLNGLRGLRGQDYSESGANQITATSPPSTLDVISVDYLIF